MLASARSRAEAAIATDDAMLREVKGNIQALLAAAARRQAAQAMAAEQAMARRASVQAALSAPAPAVVAATAAAPSLAVSGPPKLPAGQAASQQTPANQAGASVGAYADPLRGISGLTPERVDQGVDYSGFGPIFAIGDGVVLSTVNAGWPGGTFIAYRLSNGPAAGLVVYAAEDISPLVQVGQSVTASSVLGTVYEGPSGIETGWADPSGDGLTMAADAGQFGGSNSTAFGANFSQLLAATGAPGGIMQNVPATGTVPPGWPSW